jgi:hypothetical protein
LRPDFGFKLLRFDEIFTSSLSRSLAGAVSQHTVGIFHNNRIDERGRKGEEIEKEMQLPQCHKIYLLHTFIDSIALIRS